MPDITPFGSWRFNEAVRFSELVAYSVSSAYAEGRFGLRVAVYEPRLNLCKAVYDSAQSQNPIISVEFEFVETGCGAFTIETNQDQGTLDIKQGDRIDIHIMNTRQPWFSGRVAEAPTVDTESRKYEFKGHGYAELLGSVLVDEAYELQCVEAIVRDLAETYFQGRDLWFFSDRLMPVGYQVQSVHFDRTTMKEALAQLADLAHDYVYGVDEEREFFFRPREGRPQWRYFNKGSHWVGQHLGSFELKEDSSDVVNSLYVKIGTISGENSNFADFTVSDLDSIAFFDERAKVVTMPELKNETDAETWANHEVERLAWPKVTGKAKDLNLAGYVDSKDDILRAEGYLRVSMTRGGLVAPYYEPLNGYFRWQDLREMKIYDERAIKREFTCRRGGPLGRISLMLRRIGSPGTLSVAVKLGSTLLGTATVEEGSVPGWVAWVNCDCDAVTVYAGQVYTIEISAASAPDSSNCYALQYSSADAPYDGAFFFQLLIGGGWTEYTDWGLIYRAYLVHDDEFMLAIKKVKYQATPAGGITADIDLGGIEQPLEDKILDLLRQIKAEQLLQQSNVADLSA